MITSEQSINTLNELIDLNNNRAADFEKTITGMADEHIDLKETFQTYALQSRRFSRELIALTGEEEVFAEDNGEGILNHVLDEIKSIFGGLSREGILKKTLKEESDLSVAYRNALQNGELDSEAWNAVNAQLQEIEVRHQKITALNNASTL